MPRSVRFLPLLALPLLAGCEMVAMHPAGDVALQQRNIILISLGLMLLIILPVMTLTAVFAWRYRASNAEATYDPEFDHSTSLELVIWAAPLLIIIALGALTWWGTHLLDPFRPLNRISAGKPVPAGQRPLEVQVVALDWKWLFIYPEQGVATVNELVLPVDRQVRFDLTSTNMMSTFWAPSMAGMIYTMPGMRSTLHAVLNKPGSYEGLSGNYNGAGFADMRFKLMGVDDAGFARWVAAARAAPQQLTVPAMLALIKPSEKAPVVHYAAVAPALFDRVLERCLEPGRPCMSDMMKHDMARGGGRPGGPAGSGMPSGRNSAPLTGDKPKGALQKAPEEKGTSPHFTAPTAPNAGPGAKQPGDPRNRNMSLRLPLRTPGATTSARG